MSDKENSVNLCSKEKDDVDARDMKEVSAATSAPSNIFDGINLLNSEFTSNATGLSNIAEPSNVAIYSDATDTPNATGTPNDTVMTSRSSKAEFHVEG